MINCGYCKTGKDHSVAEVKACAAKFYAAKAPVKVPAGRYALEADGVTKFYVVDEGKGQWAGKVFLSVQASDEQHAIKAPAVKAAILAKIAEDVKGASVLYGQRLGRCGVCGRTLTDEDSRAAGIGPVCAGKF